MKSIAQELKYKQAMVECAIKNNNNALAGRRYNQTREYVRFWRKRYDGTLKSLMCESRAPKNPRNRQSHDQIEIIKKVFKKTFKKQKLEYFVEARKKGYKHCYQVFVKTSNILYGEIIKQNKKYKPKPYNTPKNPGEKIQLDVKFVPRESYKKSGSLGRMCQYTFIDEATRTRFLYAAMESNTYESTLALREAVNFFKELGIKIREIQTDNGFEFTTSFTKKNDSLTMFEEELKNLGIIYKRIKPYTPRHNGKVERSHRNDNERFYSRNKFKNFEDFKNKIFKYNKFSNNFPLLNLKLKTPLEVLKELQSKDLWSITM